jgi:fused
VTLKVLKYLNPEHIPISISLLSRLVFNTDSDKKFANQFVGNEGLKIIPRYKLLREDNSTILITETLSIISQLARISKEYYEPIHQINIYKELRNLIIHKDPAIRSKVCLCLMKCV